jgi:hypothetical protein
VLKAGQFMAIAEYNKTQAIMDALKVWDHLKELMDRLFHAFFVIESVSF